MSWLLFDSLRKSYNGVDGVGLMTEIQTENNNTIKSFKVWLIGAYWKVLGLRIMRIFFFLKLSKKWRSYCRKTYAHIWAYIWAYSA